MINWRNGKGGFVGGLKYAIKGLFQFAHSITSAAPTPPSPDCDIGFEGKIEGTIAFEGKITEDIAFEGQIDATDIGLIGNLTDIRVFSGILDPNDLGFEGNLTDEIGFEGDLCED